MRSSRKEDILATFFLLIGAALILYEILNKQYGDVRMLIGSIGVMFFLYRMMKKIFIRYIAKNWNSVLAKITYIYYPRRASFDHPNNFAFAKIEAEEIGGTRIFKTKARLDRIDYTKYYGMKVHVYYHPVYKDIYFIDMELAEQDLTAGIK